MTGSQNNKPCVGEYGVTLLGLFRHLSFCFVDTARLHALEPMGYFLELLHIYSLSICFLCEVSPFSFSFTRSPLSSRPTSILYLAFNLFSVLLSFTHRSSQRGVQCTLYCTVYTVYLNIQIA